MVKRAAKGPSGRSDADVASLRARAAVLYADGKDAREVAAALGITERQARRYKADVAGVVKQAAASTIGGIVEAANRARNVAAENGEALMNVLVDGALGRLKHGDDNRSEDPIERDPQMVNARTKAASIALQFILAQKLDATVTGSIEMTLAQRLQKRAAEFRSEEDGE